MRASTSSCRRTGGGDTCVGAFLKLCLQKSHSYGYGVLQFIVLHLCIHEVVPQDHLRVWNMHIYIYIYIYMHSQTSFPLAMIVPFRCDHHYYSILNTCPQFGLWYSCVTCTGTSSMSTRTALWLHAPNTWCTSTWATGDWALVQWGQHYTSRVLL